MFLAVSVDEKRPLYKHVVNAVKALIGWSGYAVTNRELHQAVSYRAPRAGAVVASRRSHDVNLARFAAWLAGKDAGPLRIKAAL
jgi:hypothetical protein